MVLSSGQEASQLIYHKCDLSDRLCRLWVDAVSATHQHGLAQHDDFQEQH